MKYRLALSNSDIIYGNHIFGKGGKNIFYINGGNLYYINEKISSNTLVDESVSAGTMVVSPMIKRSFISKRMRR